MKRFNYNPKQSGFGLSKFGICFFIITGIISFDNVKGQHQYPTAAVPALAAYHTGVPTILNDSSAGSPYLSPSWMTGKAQLTLKQSIPNPNETLYFNYDKTNNTLIAADVSGQITFYTVNLVNSFELTDSSGKTYKFELFPVVSNSFFLVDMIKSNKGYTLYKRFITKLSVSNNQGQGSFTIGEKHDVYTDYIMYYLIYPDKYSYKSFQLSEKAVKKAFKDEPANIDEWLDKYKSKFNEEALIEIVKSVNARYYP
jgi:hypothetical protein